MNPKIWLSSPHMGTNEFKNVKEAFDTNWIAPLGPHVDGFERDLADFLREGMHVAALSSGTAALHLALIMLGVKAGDEVICQSMTFSASANPIAYQGAIPVFVDSEDRTWNMSPDLLELAIQDRMRKGKKPKAIIVVHLYGMPAEMDRIMAIADRHEIPVVEDAAEAVGSSFKGQKLGTFGAMSILSFNGNKIITTSGGGALVSNNEAYIKQARFLATQARDAAPHYQHSHIGYNYRMSNVCAAIGRGQMDVLLERVQQRRANYTFYQKTLAAIPAIQFAEEPNGEYYSNRWLSTVLVDDSQGISREDIRLALEKENIESRPLWKPMHLQPVFANAPYYGDGTSDRLFDQGLCLPSGSNMTDEERERVVDCIKACFAQ
ncbi:DegT/DnrJ/EryC1/StrS aminotransferase family protein [Pontibacter sp. HSC-36F09]|uniref:DegT/DnrJ/EryC1/StrS family aminotransferase n=1 Tax=Pontibacter sp. HSC-36F09 TaxID=2910966 RepID=UPI00209D9583|nr:aminotransferase class I/II-fold pyridoxal phosphate-dependent enzyme [Pontibacter sp. HSC-36F09]MCP2043688.1 dTDP-4-amino-4,6-dideoxygalactose transaminase [Pontibacter sp. HSC-36F09]